MEERVGGQVKAQYVWSPVYVDALVLRDRDSNGDGTLDERLYVVQDANYNVVALFDNSGNVVERYVYDPFGQATVLDAGWNVLAASAFAWIYLHQGGRFDATSGLYHFRHRDYSPTLGRWTSLDPIRYEAGDVNLYRSIGNSPKNAVDPSGLSGAAAHHPYPLMLGGADATQPLFDLTEAQHTAAEGVFKKYGVHNHNYKAGHDAARARWAAFGLDKQRAIIIESLKAAGVHDSLIQNNIDKIMEGAQPGKNCTTLTRAPIKGRVISKEAIEAAAKLGKLATALGGVVIFGGVAYANDKYVETGEKTGMKLATKATLMFELRRAWNSDELPNRSFIIKWYDGAVYVRYECNREGNWIVAQKVTLDEKGRLRTIDDYLIKPGDLPLDFKPGNPLTVR